MSHTVTTSRTTSRTHDHTVTTSRTTNRTHDHIYNPDYYGVASRPPAATQVLSADNMFSVLPHHPQATLRLNPPTTSTAPTMAQR
jgi:hypothetical protein